METCCNLGNEFDKKRNILYETDNFFVVPTVGQIGIEGYLLICSKEHFIGVGGMPEKYQQELEETIKKTRNVLSKTYNSDVLVFEHGPRIACYRGGGCLDHSHLHLVPVSEDIMEPLVVHLLRGLQLKEYYKLERISGFDRLKEIYDKQESSYLFIETAKLERYTTEVNFQIPSQYLRQIVASKIGKINDWDWRIKPDNETFERTIENLKAKF